ncbi:hypothetical protein JHK85_007382 [Glycine max]|nr:hypothetical protein JHK85_007382 [Glycine max]KAG5071960.1 hypothetical protein JHK86_007171 [Glycine max]
MGRPFTCKSIPKRKLLCKEDYDKVCTTSPSTPTSFASTTPTRTPPSWRLATGLGSCIGTSSLRTFSLILLRRVLRFGCSLVRFGFCGGCRGEGLVVGFGGGGDSDDVFEFSLAEELADAVDDMLGSGAGVEDHAGLDILNNLVGGNFLEVVLGEDDEGGGGGGGGYY